MSIQPANDFQPVHTFPHEELDDAPLLHFHESDTLWNSPGNAGGAWQAMVFVAQRNSVTVLFSFIYAIRRAGHQRKKVWAFNAHPVTLSKNASLFRIISVIPPRSKELWIISTVPPKLREFGTISGFRPDVRTFRAVKMFQVGERLENILSQCFHQLSLLAGTYRTYEGRKPDRGHDSWVRRAVADGLLGYRCPEIR
jgi:hypothetical protein